MTPPLGACALSAMRWEMLTWQIFNLTPSSHLSSELDLLPPTYIQRTPPYAACSVIYLVAVTCPNLLYPRKFPNYPGSSSLTFTRLMNCVGFLRPPRSSLNVAILRLTLFALSCCCFTAQLCASVKLYV